MPERKSMKRIITEAVLAQLPLQDFDVERAVVDWWMTGRQGGLRLTAQGDAFFRVAEIEYFECHMATVPDGTWYNFILSINKKIKCPYYLHADSNSTGKKTSYIRIYDSKIAMMIELYGDLYSYLDSIQIRDR